ncbi:MAG: hypothetical protein KGJ60_02085, partial [Verrucomicrobiota bacterium]|nr:hypothetical protein [Verrucomicrobiota bacterium]
WPQNEAQISGDSFTWRGWVSDFTASITAQMVDGGGNTNILDAVVERDGHFWAENLPLSSGASTLTLTVTDAAGNVAMTNITVSQSTVQLAMYPPGSSQFFNPAMTIYGTINSSDYTVWVNGVKATVDGSGNWEADNMPNTPGGTAVFQARAIPTAATAAREQSRIIPCVYRARNVPAQFAV